MSTARPSVSEDRLAKGLGWFSIGLGVSQLLAPRQVNRLMGIAGTRRNQVIMCAVSLRELGGAVGVLRRPRPTGFLFARVAGDVMDLLLLRAALGRRATLGAGWRSRSLLSSASRFWM